ncbi:MAG: hypothetical protein EOM72_06680 [Opitutae bacterium]|nr:hypothetical protein [Opitutae bacterium]
MANLESSSGWDSVRRLAVRWVAGLAGAGLAWLGPTTGAAQPAFSLAGNVRSLFSALNDYPNPNLAWEREDGVSSDTILRLIGEGQLRDGWTCEIHGAQRVRFETLEGAGAGRFGWGEPVSATGRYRATREDGMWAEHEDGSAELSLDRLSLKVALSKADILLGRQAVNFNQAYFWNPLDVFAPFGPLQFDRDYKTGVDAARVDVPLGRLGGVNLIGALGGETERDDVSWEGSALLARAFANWRDWDWALQGGKICGGYMAGGGASGELGLLAVRGEAAHFEPDERNGFSSIGLTGHAEVVLGAGRRFFDSLDVEAEYFFNGAGESEHLNAALPRLAAGTSRQMGRQFLGTAVRYEIHPRWTGSLLWILSFTDGSSVLQPGLAFSASEGCDLLLGGLAGLGEDLDGTTVESEFGAYPDILYVELKLYF